MSTSHLPTQADTTLTPPPAPKFISLLTGLLALPAEIRLQIYEIITSSASFSQTIQFLDTVKCIGRTPYPATQDTFRIILPYDYSVFLQVHPRLSWEFNHFLMQPITMTPDERPCVKYILLLHDGTSKGDEMIKFWLKVFAAKTFQGLHIGYTLKDRRGITYQVQCSLGDGDVDEQTKKSDWIQWDTKWCLAAAKWALFAYLTRELRNYHERELACWSFYKGKIAGIGPAGGCPPKQPDAN